MSVEVSFFLRTNQLRQRGGGRCGLHTVLPRTVPLPLCFIGLGATFDRLYLQGVQVLQVLKRMCWNLADLVEPQIPATDRNRVVYILLTGHFFRAAYI